jgi:hypothetical protein
MDYYKNLEERVFEIIKKEIFTLPYFVYDNFFQNMRDLKKEITTKLPYDFQAMYDPETNTLFALEGITNAIMLVHEYLHMMSTNRTDIENNNYTCGYAECKNGNINNIGFNEGITQWLTCKFFGIPINENKWYVEETIIVDKLIKTWGENIIFSGYFKGGLEKLMSNLDSESQKKLREIIDLMSNNNQKESESKGQK